MFSGIISHTVTLLKKEWGTLTVSNPFWMELTIGQSIAHDWACMTVTEFNETQYSFFAMEESLNKTTLGTKHVGDVCNVERCLQLWDRVDGHFVSGHIDTLGSVSGLETWEDGSLNLTVSFDKEFSDYVIYKGSITLNGVSLTVTDCKEGQASVWLIPLTQEVTNLGSLKIGDAISIEFDMLWKYSVQYAKNALSSQK